MTLLQKRDRVHVALLIIAMIATPLAISYVSANVTGWFSTTTIDFRPANEGPPKLRFCKHAKKIENPSCKLYK